MILHCCCCLCAAVQRHAAVIVFQNIFTTPYTPNNRNARACRIFSTNNACIIAQKQSNAPMRSVLSWVLRRALLSVYYDNRLCVCNVAAMTATLHNSCDFQRIALENYPRKIQIHAILTHEWTDRWTDGCSVLDSNRNQSECSTILLLICDY